MERSCDKYSPSILALQEICHILTTNLISVITTIPFLSKTKPNKLINLKNKQVNAYHTSGPV